MSAQHSPQASDLTEQLVQRIAELEAENVVLREHAAVYKYSEQQLRVSEDRFRAIFHSSPDAMALLTYPSLTEPMKVLDCNTALCWLLNRTHAELIGIPAGSFASNPYTPAERACYVERLISGERVTYETQQWRADGSLFIADIVSTNVTIAGQNLILAIARDISQRKQVEQELRLINSELEQRVAQRTRELVEVNENLVLRNVNLSQSSHLLSTILNKLSDGLALLDEVGNILIVNHALAHLVGIAPEALANQTWASLGLGELSFTTSAQCKLTYSSLNGHRSMLEIQSSLIESDNEHLNSLLVRVIDITERLHLETITIQNERLIASGRLAEVVAHEVNTPLQAMQNLVYLAQISPKEQSDRYLALVHDEIRRVGATINRLLDLNQGSSDTWEMLDCNALIERMLLLTEMLLLGHHITIVRDLSANLVQVWGTADSLCQVLLNLIINASDAMPHGGTLTLRTMLRIAQAAATAAEPSLLTEAEPTDLRLIIEVEDSGEGIAPQLLKTIFQPFFTTKSLATGTGLGLSISQRIVHEHGGRIWADSQLNRGTILTVELPIHS